MWTEQNRALANRLHACGIEVTGPTQDGVSVWGRAVPGTPVVFRAEDADRLEDERDAAERVPIAGLYDDAWNDD